MFEKPCFSTVIVYVDGVNGEIRNVPRSVVVAVRVAPFRSFLTVTVAPGTNAPVWSRTDPEMLPSVCANAAPDDAATNAIAAIHFNTVMCPPALQNSGQRSDRL